MTNFFKKIWRKVCDAGVWVKKQAKKIAVALGIVSVAVASTLIPGKDTDVVPFVEVNGQTITFPYTDDNSNEDIIIRTDSGVYRGPGYATMYVMVENKSGKAQSTLFQTLFKNSTKTAGSISVLQKGVPKQTEVIDYEIVPCDSETSTECRQEKGSHFDTVYEDVWVNQDISSLDISDIQSLIASKQISRKEIGRFVTDKVMQISLANSAISYFKIDFSFPRYSEEEFFLEAVGDNGGYGHLDPWFEDAVDEIRQATDEPTYIEGSNGSGSYADTLTSNNTRLVVADSGGSSSNRYKINISFDGVSGSDQWGDFMKITPGAVHSIDFSFEGKDSLGTNDYYVQMWDFIDSQWEDLESAMSLGTTEQTLTRSVASDFANYFNASKEVKIRIANGKALGKAGAPDKASQLEIDYMALEVHNWLTGWTYRIKISINPANIDADLTNFPILVHLDDDTEVDFANFATSTTGEDIRFTQSDGETELNFERENHTATSANYWVSVPTISSSTDSTTTIYMYYGNSSAADGQQATSTWDSNFQAVHHLAGAAETDLDDSTQNNNDFTLKNGTPDFNYSSLIGNGVQFVRASSEYITAPEGTLDNTGAMTYSIWCNAEDNSQSYYFLVVKGDPTNPQLGFKNSDLSNKNFFSVYNSGFYSAQGSVLSTGQWYLITGRYDPTDSAAGVEVFVNGTSAGTTSAPASVSTNDGLLYLGASPYGNYFDGIVDEFRASNSARSDAWIKAEYYDGTDQLAVYGAEETEAVAEPEILPYIISLIKKI